MKNQLAKIEKKTKKFTPVKEISKVPSNLALLQNYIDEVVKVKQEIATRMEQIKGLRQSAVDSVNVDPKMFNALVVMTLNNNFDQKKQECWNLEEAIDAITGGTAIASTANED